MNLSFKYGNFLLVDGKFMQVGEPERLYEALLQAREIIAEKIGETEMRVAVMRLQAGKTRVLRRVIVRSKLFRPTDDHETEHNEGVFYDVTDLQPRFRIYWEMAVKAGYTPEVRDGTSSDEELGGVCLYVRPQSPK